MQAINTTASPRPYNRTAINSIEITLVNITFLNMTTHLERLDKLHFKITTVALQSESKNNFKITQSD